MPPSWNSIAEVTEGLEHRLSRALAQLPEAFSRSAAECTEDQTIYTHQAPAHARPLAPESHQSRVFPRELATGPGYLRVLGFNAQGQSLLKQMKKTASLPVVLKPSTFTHNQLELDIQAQVAYALGLRAQGYT